MKSTEHNEIKENKNPVRLYATECLTEMEKTKEYGNLLVNQILQKYNYWPTKDKAFLKCLVEGSVERRIQIDYVINLFSKTKTNKMKPLIRSLLRMSVYQLLFMDSVPDSAVCNEACKIAEKKGFGSLKGFVNGVLRSIARGKEKLEYPSKETDLLEYLSVMYSMPMFLVKMWVEKYGAETTEKMLSGFLEKRPVTIRFSVRLSEEERKAYLEEFEKANVNVEKSKLLPYAYHLRGVAGVESLKGFEEGAFYVQDVSSMLAVEAAGIKEGDFVLDVCAAPGGKTLLAAEKTTESGMVVARDVSEYKTNLIRENTERMQCTQVKIQVKDATEFDEKMVQRADVVIADLPCSGLGILGRKADIKYHCTETSLEDIVVLQKKIIDTIWDYVKPGAVFMFSTCTIHEKENEQMVEYITKQYPFELEAFEEGLHLPESAKKERPGMCQLMPGFDETDGFFFAKLRRRKES